MTPLIDGLRDQSTAELRTQSFARQLWRFARPHTVVGTTLSLFALWVMARGLFRAPVAPGLFGAPGDHGAISLSALALTWLACIGANVYIVGLNQLTDTAIDRVNKPYLPLASGAWSRATGQLVIGVSLAVALAATALVGSRWLSWTVGLSLLLGTAYSLPPLRLKRFAFWAAFCIIAVRSLIVNLLLFAHVADWRSAVTDLPPVVWLLVGVMFAFSVAIAWFKDLPDLLGDREHGIATLTVRLGPRRAFRLGHAVLLLVLLASAVWAYVFVGNAALAGGQLTVAAAYGLVARRLELADARSLRRFYLGVWGVFFLEYIVFAAAVWV